MTQFFISHDHATIEGYLTSLDEEKAFSILGSHFSIEKILEIKSWLKEQKVFEFVFLRSFVVEKEHRGQGIGSDLLWAFISRAADLPIILLCDETDTQEHSGGAFNLREWYESYDFQSTSFLSSAGPLMIKR